VPSRPAFCREMNVDILYVQSREQPRHWPAFPAFAIGQGLDQIAPASAMASDTPRTERHPTIDANQAISRISVHTDCDIVSPSLDR